MHPITFDSEKKFHYQLDESIYKEAKTHFNQLERGRYESLNPEVFAKLLKSTHASGDLNSSSCCPIANGHFCWVISNVNSFIKWDTTEAGFDAFLRSQPDFRHESGDYSRINALCAASYAGNDKLVTHILKSGGIHLVNLASEGRKTPLMWAASCENLLQGFKVAEVLLNHKANVISATVKEWTALKYALELKNVPLAQKLLRSGAIIRIKLNNSNKRVFEEAVSILFTRYLAIRNRLSKDLIPSIIDKSI